MTKEQLLLYKIGQTLVDTQWEGKVFVAGGFVRDEVLGIPSKDLDFVVAQENGGIEFAEWLARRFNCFRPETNPVIFPRFGTAKLTIDGIDVECVMTRGEIYTSGSRNPEVVFASLKEDVMRRDFTINSLLKDVVSGEILDLTGEGLLDIERGRISTPNEPKIIFKDDPLRMMRAVRFSAKFKWGIAMRTFTGIIDNAHEIHIISPERIQDELNKMLMTANPGQALRTLMITGLLREIIPELADCVDVEQNHYHKDDVFHHIVSVVENTPATLVGRLAAMFHDIGKPATKEVDENGKVHFHEHEDVGAGIAAAAMLRLRYPLDLIDTVVLLVENHMRIKKAGENGEKITNKGLRRLRNAVGEHLETMLDVMHADNISHADAHSMPNQVPGIRQRFAELKDEPVKVKLPINGHDVMEICNIKPGPRVKEILMLVEEAWFENPQLTREEALSIIATMALIDR